MKPLIVFAASCLLLASFETGCGRPTEETKKAMSLQSELSQLQKELWRILPNLNRAAGQIDSIARREDKSAKMLAVDVQSAKEMIMAAFKAYDDQTWEIPPLDDSKGAIRALEVDTGILKNALAKTTAAINKAHDVVGALDKGAVQSKTGKR